jgi:hypothetical protein
MGDFIGKRAEIGVYDDAIGDIDDFIKSASKLQNNAPKKVYLTTSSVYDALMKDVTFQRGQFVIVPEGTFPEGVHTIELSETQCVPNRAERRKRQREAKEGVIKNNI